MILIFKMLDMILIFGGNSSVLQGKYVSSSWLMKSIISLIVTPIMMACTRMVNLLMSQFTNVRIINPSQTVLKMWLRFWTDNLSLLKWLHVSWMVFQQRIEQIYIMSTFSLIVNHYRIECSVIIVWKTAQWWQAISSTWN